MDDELKQEMEVLSNEDLECIANIHIMFAENCPREVKTKYFEGKAVARAILDSRLNPQTSATMDTACL